MAPRLTVRPKIEAIVKNFRQTFGDGELYLFGSRVDGSKKAEI